ncbi:Cation-independent mannose-6-phosphate receptor CI-MPR [Coemansia javaensis]|uniref:Cation-independent mannose-6-phosphate receptor CI-MPR n=1 Tax=Coemansia javaensis TaxID=2761396 RepID=A0A9W8H8H8_9FUNG|nr:Cation-independent mannose-6-phosphate receptor CI-MPR [Coemansia javaensis]
MHYDLRPLARHGDGYSVEGHGDGYAFKLNVCRALPGPPGAMAGAQWSAGGQAGSLGRLSTTPRLRSGRLSLAYTDGDVCSEAPHLRKSAFVSFVCAPDTADLGQPVLVAEWAKCGFVFEWRTPAACPRASAAEDAAYDDGGAPAEDASRGSVAFVAVFVLGSIYMLGGFLYNRVLNTSQGLRGIEQLPNYRLWRGIYLAARRVAAGAASGVLYLVDAASGRRGAIRIDDAEHSIRAELFGPDDDYYDDDDDGPEVLPIARR